MLINGRRGSAPDLVSRQTFGDVEVHVDFKIPRRSNSGVKLMGLYEVQIFDSWGVKEPTGSDCGGIYPRAELTPTYHYLDKGVGSDRAATLAAVIRQADTAQQALQGAGVRAAMFAHS